MDGTIHVTDWERFKTYAQRIRSVKLSQYDRIAASVYTALYRHNGERPILPLLRFVSWEQMSETFDDTLKFFMSPELRGLHLRVIDYAYTQLQRDALTNEFERLLSGLSPLAPNVAELYIKGNIQRCPPSVGSFPRMRRIEINFCRLNAESLHPLSLLENLTDISIAEARVQTILPRIGQFEMLTCLQLSFDGFSGTSLLRAMILPVSGLLSSISSPRLHHLTDFVKS